MKIRNGFVSNSSSSSFVVLGYCIDGSYEEFFTEEFNQKINDSSLEEALEEYELVTGATEDSDEYIGVEPDISDDTKTVGQLKKEVKDKLNLIVKKEQSIDLYAGTYFN
jgi:hypothetical protein